METNYRIAYAKGWQDVKEKDPLEIAARLAVTFHPDTQQFTLEFFGEEYLLDWATEKIWRKTDGQVPEITDSIIMLNYLSFSDSLVPPTDQWVSLKEIPNGGALFYPAFRENTIQVIIQTFGHRPDHFRRCAAALGGKPGPFKGVSAVFQAFPEIPLSIILWEGDEEISANATVLMQPSIASLLHIECLIGLGMLLGTKLRDIGDRDIGDGSSCRTTPAPS